MNTSIIDFLHTHGEKMEAEIATALQLPMAHVQSQLAQLRTTGDVICCKVIRYLGGKKIEGTSYRLSGTRGGKPILPIATHKAR